jgi:hypothetical protein
LRGEKAYLDSFRSTVRRPQPELEVMPVGWLVGPKSVGTDHRLHPTAGAASDTAGMIVVRQPPVDPEVGAGVSFEEIG